MQLPEELHLLTDDDGEVFLAVGGDVPNADGIDGERFSSEVVEHCPVEVCAESQCSRFIAVFLRFAVASHKGFDSIVRRIERRDVFGQADDIAIAVLVEVYDAVFEAERDQRPKLM